MKNTPTIKKNHNTSSILIGLIIIFIVLGFSAHYYAFFDIDLQISRYLQGYKNSFFSLAMNFVSEIGDDFHLELIVISMMIALIYSGSKMEAFKLAVASLAGVAVGSISKLIVARPRPISDLVNIQEILNDKSFPSLHVLLFTVIFGYLIYLAPQKIRTTWLKNLVVIGATTLLLTIGVSRIYLGVHWASDTLGGYVMGAIILICTINLNKK